jgi:hypothetical protein
VGAELVTWCHKIHRLPAWGAGPNCLRYPIVLDTQRSSSVVLGGPAFVASSEYAFDLDFRVSWCRAAHRRVAVAEARCAAELIVSVLIEVARLATATE